MSKKQTQEDIPIEGHIKEKDEEISRLRQDLRLRTEALNEAETIQNRLREDRDREYKIREESVKIIKGQEKQIEILEHKLQTMKWTILNQARILTEQSDMIFKLRKPE